MKTTVLVLLAIVAGVISTEHCFDPAIWDSYLDKAYTIHNMTEDYRVQRNHLIVQTYHEMGTCLSRMINMPGQATWMNFASWASFSVGQGIREESFNIYMEEILHCPNTFIPKILCDLISKTPNILRPIMEKTLKSASAALGLGNNEVYRQIGITTTKFGTIFSRIEKQNVEEASIALKQFLEEHIPSHQKYLRESYSAYWRLRYDKKLESQKQRDLELFYANINMGMDEQISLQTYLDMALKPTVILGISFDVDAIFTQRFMCLLLPKSELLFTGKDVIRREDGQNFPSTLMDISSHDAAYKMYTTVLKDVNSLSGTAAIRWSRLNDRMRFVMPMMRSRQNHLKLQTCHQFSKSQISALDMFRPIEGPFCLLDCCKKNGEYPNK